MCSTKLFYEGIILWHFSVPLPTWFICTLVTLRKGKMLQMIYVQDYSGVKAFKVFFFFSHPVLYFSSVKGFVLQNVAVSIFKNKTVKWLCFIWEKIIKTLRCNSKLNCKSYQSYFSICHVNGPAYFSFLNNGPIVVDLQSTQEYYFHRKENKLFN